MQNRISIKTIPCPRHPDIYLRPWQFCWLCHLPPFPTWLFLALPVILASIAFIVGKQFGSWMHPSMDSQQRSFALALTKEAQSIASSSNNVYRTPIIIAPNTPKILLPTNTITLTLIPKLTATVTTSPSAIQQPTVSSTVKDQTTPTNTGTLEPTIPSLKAGIKIDTAMLIFIPAGSFTMGSDPNTDPYYWGAEAPPHEVYLDGYWIMQTEVTNSMYQEYVMQKACPLPANYGSRTRRIYYGNSEFADYPVIFVSYVHASSFCLWAGGRLPTEAQWEKAARSDDGRLFPWGNQDPTEEHMNLSFDDTLAVGKYPDGASPYGLLDMAGNVWEWTFDWFGASYYNVSQKENPLGPASGETRVIRGGSYGKAPGGVRVVVRTSLKPDETLDTLGF